MGPKKERGRGRPPVDSEAVKVRIGRSELDAIDAFAAKEADKPGRPEAVRRIVRAWLTARGFIKGAGA